MIIDCHTHSTNSPDGYDAPEAMVAAAVEKGLAVYALTDHCEINRWFRYGHYGDPSDNPQDTYDFAHDFEMSMEDNTRLKEKYKDKIKFINGIELGQAQFEPGLAKAVSEDCRLDFIIGSVHQVRGYDDFAFTDYTKVSAQELVNRYYREIYEVCGYGYFDVLGHLTYPLRYIEGNFGITVDMKENDEIIAESFKLIIKNGKGIEINTSGLRQKYGKTFPDIRYLKMYRDLGGKVISVGSDAHRIEDIASGVKDGLEMAKSAGFDSFAYFEKHVPVSVKI